MSVSATEAKNRFGQLLEQAQRAPVVIEKAGRRHSVLLSVEQYELLLSAQRHDAHASGHERRGSGPVVAAGVEHHQVGPGREDLLDARADRIA